MTPQQQELLAKLDYGCQRLRTLANNCRGTVCDDDKAWALDSEADAIVEARAVLWGVFNGK